MASESNVYSEGALVLVLTGVDVLAGVEVRPGVDDLVGVDVLAGDRVFDGLAVFVLGGDFARMVLGWEPVVEVRSVPS